MIGTIRRHSKWLWLIVVAATVISFLYWGAAPVARNGSVGGSGGYGTIYGHKITAQEYENAKREFDLFYWFHNGEWPERNPNIKDPELQQQIYIRVMINQKAGNLGIHIGDEATFTYASAMLRSPELARTLGVNSQNISVEMFVKQVLQPEGLTADDFERFARNDLAIQQLVQTMGLTGELITPQEAAAIYQRQHQEVAAQAVFFSASNFVPQIAVTPAAVAQFYTNYLAEYRLPDRVQVSYVEFNVTNFLAQARTELTNLDDMVQLNYNRLGPDYFSDAKTPEAAKAKIRDQIIRLRALTAARQQANDFATAVFNQSPPRAENLAAFARQKGLAARVTAPFASLYGPDEFTAPAAFTKAAFALTPDDPFAGPILDPNGVYVIALDKQLPSEIPTLDQIRDRVTRDFQTQHAIALAQRVGTNFVGTLNSQLMAGHGFVSVCIAAGLHPEVLPPFSLSTEELPELANRAGLPQVKQATFSTPPGRASGFEPTDDGGFIVFVEKLLPFDQTALNTDLPQYLAGLRRARENEVFNQWVNLEANRELRNIPIFQQLAAGAK